MKFDEYGAIVMERDGWPGDIGDSAHETARYSVLLGSVPFPALEQFISLTGFLRHPTAPENAPGSGENWREPDATSDLVLPLLMAMDLHADPRASGSAEIIRARLRSTWTVAPGHIASPALMALAYKKMWLFRFFTWFQRLLFVLPLRWSDDNRLKGKLWKFVSTDDASADWLNWIVSMVYIKRMQRRDLLNKPRSYYASQPHSDWILMAYEKGIDDIL